MYRAKGYWEGITLAEMLDASAARWGPKTALTAGAQNLTYAELKARADHLAAELAASGLSPLDRVILQINNVPLFVLSFFALMRIGVIPVMALPPHRYAEVRHFVDHSQAVGYFIPDRIKDFDFRDLAQRIQGENRALAHVFVAGEARPGQHSLPALLAAPAAAIDPARLRADPSEVALMLLSGGTTALPKLIPRTHNDYVCNAKVTGEVCGFDEDTVLLAVLPMAHNYTLASPGILGTFARGGRVVLAPATDPETVFSLVEKERVTVIPAAVPLITSWLNSDVPRRHDLSSLQAIQNGGARLAPELRQRLRERFGCRNQEIYGTAEGLINLTRAEDPLDVQLKSSGSPACPDDEIKVLDESGSEVADGDRGELVVRGPYTIRGYYRNPEANKKSFTADGFYRMGDVVRKWGRVLSAEGRKGDLINRGGEKISCEEVENLILRHPAVVGVCLVAMPDPIYGEKACAFVIKRQEAQLDFAGLKAFLLAEDIAKFKLPERLEVVDTFPLSPAGKILRRKLREAIEAKLAAEGMAAPRSAS